MSALNDTILHHKICKIWDICFNGDLKKIREVIPVMRKMHHNEITNSLLMAFSSGKIESCQLILEVFDYIDYGSEWQFKEAMLDMTVIHNNLELIRYAQRQFNISTQDIKDCRIIQYATRIRSKNIIHWLIENVDYTLDELSYEDLELLKVAVVINDMYTVLWLLRNFDLTSVKFKLSRVTALLNACYYGYLDIVMVLTTHFCFTVDELLVDDYRIFKESFKHTSIFVWLLHSTVQYGTYYGQQWVTHLYIYFAKANRYDISLEILKYFKIDICDYFDIFINQLDEEQDPKYADQYAHKQIEMPLMELYAHEMNLKQIHPENTLKEFARDGNDIANKENILKLMAKLIGHHFNADPCALAVKLIKYYRSDKIVHILLLIMNLFVRPEHGCDDHGEMIIMCDKLFNAGYKELPWWLYHEFFKYGLKK